MSGSATDYALRTGPAADLRIPVVGNAFAHPDYPYVLSIVVESPVWQGVLPEAGELALIRRFIDFLLSSFDDAFRAKLAREPFDCSSFFDTISLIKRSRDRGWAYRAAWWPNYKLLEPSPWVVLTLDEILTQIAADEGQRSAWTAWQNEHPIA